MTAKEKAKELVDKFRNEFTWVEKDHNVDLYRDAKQCALIAVDEIIRANPHSNPFNTDLSSTMAYWNEVRKEIENI